MLEVENILAGYKEINILREVSLGVKEHEVVITVGPNGAGKSTLMKAISGLIPIRGGRIQFEGADIGGLPPDDIVRLGIAQVLEGRQIFRQQSVIDNLELGFYSHYFRQGKTRMSGEMKKIFDLFPVLKARKQQVAGTLSGGEQQMLAIGRALMALPKLLLLDEPSQGLAPLVNQTIFKAISFLPNENVSILLVEQNLRAALKIANRGYVMERGSILFEGDKESLQNTELVKEAYFGRKGE